MRLLAEKAHNKTEMTNQQFAFAPISKALGHLACRNYA
ncbi:hypothetical protein C942_02299 [Photobacterium marinum]|uniref:Uncharacterized protein n=1 Tax=Photobacterium marinum TaxID=1056511 RepID=L8J958_9GAMM|nr:hypothetical protein C942_02299 [Photobacterium marinum]